MRGTCMKLYYDMLIPFMPEQKVDSETDALVDDSIAINFKSALINLSDFQNSRNPLFLYRSILNVCKALNLNVGTAVLDAIRNANSPVDGDAVEHDGIIDSLIDSAAIMIFEIAGQETPRFDVTTYIANLLYAAHITFQTLTSNSADTVNNAEVE